ncbi:MnhB domain-containing protein [Saccharothrix isguenensis]
MTRPSRQVGEEPIPGHSLLLEVVTRLLFPSIFVLSLYLLFSGHEGPGGGFTGGLVAAEAFVLRYLAGGARELEATLPVRPVVLAAAGLVPAAAVGIVPLLFGAAPLSSHVVTLDLGTAVHVQVPTSLFFDIGVYLLVVGASTQLLSAFGPSLEPGGDA